MMTDEKSGTIECNVKQFVLRWHRNIVSDGTTVNEDGDT